MELLIIVANNTCSCTANNLETFYRKSNKLTKTFTTHNSEKSNEIEQVVREL